LRVADLEADEEGDGFDAVVAAVDIIAWVDVKLTIYTQTRDGSHTHEEIICIWVGAADFEQLHEVVKLAVYVSAHCDRAFLEQNQR